MNGTDNLTDRGGGLSEIFKTFADLVKTDLNREIGAIGEVAAHHERVRRALAE